MTGMTVDEEAAVPLLEAVPVEDTPKNENDQTEDDGTTRRVFQVVAPADLPKGYRLTVVTAKSNEEVVVLVPPEGVNQNQTFQGKEARPLTKRWADSEFDCSPSYEGSFCCLAICFPALAWAFVLRKLGMDPCGCKPAVETASSRKWANLTPWIVGIVLLFSQMLQPFACLYILYLVTMARGAVRSKYNIPGSRLCDCLCATCFGCCTVLQSYRHMKRNGDTPCTSKGCGDRMVVATQV